MAYRSESELCDSPDFQHLTWHGPVYTNTFSNTNSYSHAYTDDSSSDESHYNTWHGLSWLKHKRHPRHRYLYRQDGLTHLFPPTGSQCNSPECQEEDPESQVHDKNQGQGKISLGYDDRHTSNDKMTYKETSLATPDKPHHQMGDVHVDTRKIVKKKDPTQSANRSISGKTAAMLCCWLPNDDDQH